ncbi:MAG: hypothetical protein WKH64_07615 [Chloroflexia bacterium]
MLDIALHAFKSKGPPDPPPIAGLIPSDLLDALRMMEGDPTAYNLAVRLERYVAGSLAGLFNHPTNVDLDNRMIVFDVFGIKDASQQALALHMITKYVWRRITGEIKPRMLVIDEAWTLMQHEKGGEFLFEFAKKARKRYLGVTTITQDIGLYRLIQSGRREQLDDQAVAQA